MLLLLLNGAGHCLLLLYLGLLEELLLLTLHVGLMSLHHLLLLSRELLLRRGSVRA